MSVFIKVWINGRWSDKAYLNSLTEGEEVFTVLAKYWHVELWADGPYGLVLERKS